jgi:hypothetical protein
MCLGVHAPRLQKISEGYAQPLWKKQGLDLLYRRPMVYKGPVYYCMMNLTVSLGEMQYELLSDESWFNLPGSGGIAYAAQESWVQNETITVNPPIFYDANAPLILGRKTSFSVAHSTGSGTTKSSINVGSLGTSPCLRLGTRLKLEKRG